MLETSARLLELLALLQARREWPGPELADRLEVGVRTVRRDVERLRRLGYPVEATRGVAGGYRLARGASLPPLLLDDEEATAIAVGLRAAAGTSVAGIEEPALRALVKLEQVLPARLRRRVSALGEATVATPGPTGPTVDPEVLTVIAGSCRDGIGLRFDYRTRAGAGGRRHLEPHSLANLGRRWYLVGWDRDRDDWRTFRVDRIGRPAPTAERCEGRELPATDAAEFVAASISSAPYRYEARVTVHAPAERIGGTASGRWGTVAPIDDRSCEYRSGDDDLGWLALRIVMLGADFEVHEPPELIEHLRTIGRRLAGATA